MIYCLYTVVDITETKQRHDGTHLERSQQQNFDIVIQTLGLVSNIFYETSPVVTTYDFFKGKKVWYFEWTTERDEVFEKDGDLIGRLPELFNYVPVITGLTEDASLDKPMFVTGTNIVFKIK